MVLKHLAMNANGRRAILPYIDNLLREEVLLGVALGSREMLR